MVATTPPHLDTRKLSEATTKIGRFLPERDMIALLPLFATTGALLNSQTASITALKTTKTACRTALKGKLLLARQP